MTRSGMVALVGAGPGDPSLITAGGLQWLRRADVIVFDRLAASALLCEAPDSAEFVDVGKRPGKHPFNQNEINALLTSRAKRGAIVVRLKGGDPFVFGRGGEEVDACRDAQIDVVVVPGVSSALAGPAAVGVPVTHRGVSRSFAVLTGRTEGGERISDEQVLAAQGVDTVVFLMSRANLRGIMQQLRDAGRSPTTPAMCIERATMRDQRVTIATVGDLADAVERDGLRAPIVAVVGSTVAHARSQDACHALPLAGRRILITSTVATARRFRRAVRVAGAWPIMCPMIAIDYPDAVADLDNAIARLDRYDWAVFPSVHAVVGFVRRLQAVGTDVRALCGLKLAAIGRATRGALRLRGLKPDVMPATFTADALGDALCAVKPRFVLYPCSDRARHTLPNRLRGEGTRVDCVTAYRTVPASPSIVRVRAAVESADVVVFSSPSAVEQFALIGGGRPDGIIACIGPVTAKAAQRAGWSVDVVPCEHSTGGLISALEKHFRKAMTSA